MLRHLRTAAGMLIYLLTFAAVTQAADKLGNVTQQKSKVEAQDTKVTAPTKLQLKLSPQELNAVIAKHRGKITEIRGTQLDEVVVNAPVELLPMRSETNDIWGGVLAPVWAVMHPTQSWRIFLPIPER